MADPAPALVPGLPRVKEEDVISLRRWVAPHDVGIANAGSHFSIPTKLHVFVLALFFLSAGQFTSLKLKPSLGIVLGDSVIKNSVCCGREALDIFLQLLERRAEVLQHV